MGKTRIGRKGLLTDRREPSSPLKRKRSHPPALPYRIPDIANQPAHPRMDYRLF